MANYIWSDLDIITVPSVRAVNNIPIQTYNINVSNVGAGAYSLSGSDSNGSVSGNNVTVTLMIGDTVNFVVNASGHPFFIKTAATTGLGDQASGVTNNGAQNGTVSWTPDTVGTYYYICQYHPAMVGTINATANTSKHARVATTDSFTIYPDDTIRLTVNFNDSNMESIASARHSITRRPRVGQVYPRGVRGN
tara:strand:+ start:359 stop:937 length:579 start_codon:yes stop_codon:yes gene_type:complete